MRGKQPRERPTAFGRWLTAERQGRRLTMRQLAERAGVSHSRLAQVETGEAPTRYMVEQIAAGLAPDGSDGETRRAILSAGLVAAGFGPTHELDALPAPIRAVLVESLETLRGLDDERARRLAELILAAVRLMV